MKYKLIKQEPFCCVSRALQMIFERHNISYDTQRNIAYELGFRTDKDKGTHIEKEEYSISNYLRRHDIPLCFEYHYITDYNQAKKFLYENRDNDIVACYKRGAMFNKVLDGGHATLIEKIEDDMVTLVYPEDRDGYRCVCLESLLAAIKLHDEKSMAGFWLFIKKAINKGLIK